MTFHTEPTNGAEKLSERLASTLDDRERMKRPQTVPQLVAMARHASPHLRAAVSEFPALARQSLSTLDEMKRSSSLTLTQELILDLCVERLREALAPPPSDRITAVTVASGEALDAIRERIERAAQQAILALPQHGAGHSWYTLEEFSAIEQRLLAEIVAPLVRAGEIRGARIPVAYGARHELTIGRVEVLP